MKDFVEGPKVQGQNGGTLTVSEQEIATIPSFLDYLRGGWFISMNVAIDYTGSNRAYTLPNSLHFMGPSN